MLAANASLRDGTALADGAAWEALRLHALAEYPRECIGLINRAGQYIPIANTAPDPLRFAVPEKAAIGRALSTGDLRAMCHSHPDGPDCPSETDMRTQEELEVPFVIIATNGQACAPPFAWGDDLLDVDDLVGRTFRHGVRDCYALIRVWWERERGILLPDYPRSWDWWSANTTGEKDLYRRYFRDAGFREIDQSQVREGDVWLAAIRSDVPNHAGIYLDGGLALHHPSSGLPCDPGRLSKRESIARWTPWITHWLRRD